VLGSDVLPAVPARDELDPSRSRGRCDGAGSLRDGSSGVLKEHEAGRAAADLCRKHGISDQTLYNWKAKYGGLKPLEASRLKGWRVRQQSCRTDRRLKKLLAEAVMDNSVLRDLLRVN
jgi:putative transposase